MVSLISWLMESVDRNIKDSEDLGDLIGNVTKDAVRGYRKNFQIKRTV